MIRLQRLLRSTATAVVNGGASRSLSYSAATRGKFYELRVYSILPAKFGEFLKLTEQHFHLRTAHSKLIGYWTTELGGLNEVVHIWEYEDFKQRTAVRKALSQDKEWLDTYVSKAFPMISHQVNSVMYSLPWSSALSSPGGGQESSGVYILEGTTLHSGKLDQWEHRLQQGIQAKAAISNPIGMWRSAMGTLDTVFQLWSYKSLDESVAKEEKALQDEVWRETCRDVSQFVQSSWRKALSPTPFSPLK